MIKPAAFPNNKTTFRGTFEHSITNKTEDTICIRSYRALVIHRRPQRITEPRGAFRSISLIAIASWRLYSPALDRT